MNKYIKPETEVIKPQMELFLAASAVSSTEGMTQPNNGVGYDGGIGGFVKKNFQINNDDVINGDMTIQDETSL